MRPPKAILFIGVLCFWAAGWQPGFTAGPASQMFDAEGVRIHYLAQGTGEPVVLIHGLDSSAAINWELPGTLAEVARDHQAIALDLPGYGQSDKPGEDSAYGARWVEDVILLLDHLNIRKAHIVGYSMGGLVALKLIAAHPDRALSATLGGMGWMPEGGVLQKVWAHMQSPSARGVSQLALSEAEVKAIRVPTLIVVGDRDAVQKLYVAPLRALRKDWPVIEIQDAGHLDCIYKQQFKDAIVQWINTNRER